MQNILIDGRYLLQGAIASGGEARVYRARDETLAKEVALRLELHPVENASPAIAHEHPGWVQLLGFGTDSQHGTYQVFELLKGQTLAQLVRSSPLNVEDWRRFIDQSLNAVEALHAIGLPHGDLNADNFFLTDSGWKLLDLPFLRLNPPPGRSALFGSIHTLAPEQIDGHSADFLSDLYSLGCLYYFAASGAYPHPGASSQEIAIHCLLFPADSLGDKAPQLPLPWAEWVMKLISSKPGDRLPSIAAARQLLGVA